MNWYKKAQLVSSPVRDYVNDSKDIQIDHENLQEKPGLKYFPETSPQQSRTNVNENQDMLDEWLQDLSSVDIDYYIEQLKLGLLSEEDYGDIAYHLTQTSNFLDILTKYNYTTLSVGDLDYLDDTSKSNALMMGKNIGYLASQINSSQIDKFISSIWSGHVPSGFNNMLNTCFMLWKKLVIAHTRFGLFAKIVN